VLSLSPRRLGLAGAAVALTTTAIAGAAAAYAAGTAVTGGHVTLKLSSATRNAFTANHVTFDAVPRATLKNGSLTLPITGGTATPPTYVLDLAGGFKVVKGTHSANVAHIIVNTNTGKGSAIITNHSRMTVFTFGSPAGGNGGPGEAQFAFDKVSLTGAAQKTLDSALHTSVFANHPTLGASTFDVTFKS
jgi:hypothetical protein